MTFLVKLILHLGKENPSILLKFGAKVLISSQTFILPALLLSQNAPIL